jgi:hypothetical protein
MIRCCISGSGCLYEPLNLISLGFFKMGAVVDGRSGDPEPLLIGL